MKKTNKNTSTGIGLGMCFGVSIGTAIGILFDNMPIGTVGSSIAGMFICMLIGFVFGALKDQEVNKQIKEKGYTVKEIKRNEQNEEYIITIVNRLGEERVVIVPKGQMEEENFSKEDVVFLDDDGLIEQAYDKEDE